MNFLNFAKGHHLVIRPSEPRNDEFFPPKVARRPRKRERRRPRETLNFSHQKQVAEFEQFCLNLMQHNLPTKEKGQYVEFLIKKLPNF